MASVAGAGAGTDARTGFVFNAPLPFLAAVKDEDRRVGAPAGGCGHEGRGGFGGNFMTGAAAGAGCSESCVSRQDEDDSEESDQIISLLSLSLSTPSS